MNVALVGMPGTMKSTIGKKLASMLKMEFVDTDDLFEKEEGRSIGETFSDKGEEYFRGRETEIIKRVCAQDNNLISCGGGAVLREENVRHLKRGVVILLTATPEKIYERTSHNDKRPLLSGGGVEKIRQMYEARKAKYEAAADITIDTTNLLPHKAARIIKSRLKGITRNANALK